jgi:lysine 2,3-aminomutase
MIITAIDKLPPFLAASLSPEEAAFIGSLKARGLLPFGVSGHFASLAGPGREDPLRRQFIPDLREALPDPFALEDPLGEAHYRAAPRLIHQYRDRALLLAGGSCGGYCRHCFRRVRMKEPENFIGGEKELIPILAYLRAHDEIREILISGGDPLTAEDEDLDRLLREIRQARPGIMFRICTRIPITLPQRLTPETIALFTRYRPLRMVVHINHPRELAEPARQGLAAWVEAGLPAHVQTVLLRGINDRAETLAELFRECLNLGLTPYYLFQPDLAPGTAHFRLPLPQGLALYRELKTLISGLGLPAYAVDLPGGGGKITLHEESIVAEKQDPRGRVYLLKGPGGRLYPYPR